MFRESFRVVSALAGVRCRYETGRASGPSRARRTTDGAARYTTTWTYRHSNQTQRNEIHFKLTSFVSLLQCNVIKLPNQDKFNWVIFKKKSYPNEVKLTYRRLPISVIFTNPYLIMLFKRNPSKFVKFFGTYWNISAIASNLPKVFSEISIWRYRP